MISGADGHRGTSKQKITTSITQLDLIFDSFLPKTTPKGPGTEVYDCLQL